MLLYLNGLHLDSRHLTYQELQVQVFLKGVTILRKGCVCTTLYLIDMGSARVGVRYNEMLESMPSCCPLLKLASVFSLKEARNRRLHGSRPDLFEPVGRDQVDADIRGGQYFGEIAFTAMVKKMLQVPREVSSRS